MSGPEELPSPTHHIDHGEPTDFYAALDEVDETRTWRVIRSAEGYGWRLWLGPYVRVNSRRALTPMWPHIYRSGDEYCNPVLAVHLWPIGGLDIWWRGHRRGEADGPCERCLAELEAWS